VVAPYSKCILFRATQPFLFPGDWNPLDSFFFSFGASGIGGTAATPVLSTAGGGGGGGELFFQANLGFAPFSIATVTIGVAGGRPYLAANTVNPTKVTVGITTGCLAHSGANAGNLSDGATGVPGAGGGSVSNQGGLGQVLGNSGGGGNLQTNKAGNVAIGNGANGAAWNLSTIVPNVWFDPTGTVLDFNTVSALFPTLLGPYAVGLGGQGGGTASGNGGNGGFPGGAGGGGGRTGGGGGAGVDGALILYYNPAIPPPVATVGGHVYVRTFPPIHLPPRWPIFGPRKRG
jgi:hypothetical protein